MELSLLPTLNNQFVYLDKTYGGDALAVDTLLSLLETLESYTGDNSPQAVRTEILHLYELCMACRPRMANLLSDIQVLLLHLLDNPESTAAELRRVLLELLASKRRRAGESVEHALELFTPDSGLLIHSYSSVLNALLKKCAESGNPPKIYLAAQNKKKTDRLIEFLHKIDLGFRLVPEFSVSQIIKNIDVALFGALTLNAHGQLIMGPGSASLIAQLDTYKVPNYALVTTNKFSYWEEELETAFKESRSEKLSKEIQYKKHVFSHDIVPLNLVSGVVTEEGTLTPDQATARFKELQGEYFEREKRIREIS